MFIDEQSTKKWNFDFVRGEPQPGRYEWVKVNEEGNEISESKETNGKINTQEKYAKETEKNAEDSFDKSNEKIK